VTVFPETAAWCAASVTASHSPSLSITMLHCWVSCSLLEGSMHLSPLSVSLPFFQNSPFSFFFLDPPLGSGSSPSCLSAAIHHDVDIFLAPNGAIWFLSLAVLPLTLCLSLLPVLSKIFPSQRDSFLLCVFSAGCHGRKPLSLPRPTVNRQPRNSCFLWCTTLRLFGPPLPLFSSMAMAVFPHTSILGRLNGKHDRRGVLWLSTSSRSMIFLLRGRNPFPPLLYESFVLGAKNGLLLVSGTLRELEPVGLEQTEVYWTT